MPHPMLAKLAQPTKVENAAKMIKLSKVKKKAVTVKPIAVTGAS